MSTSSKLVILISAALFAACGATPGSVGSVSRGGSSSAGLRTVPAHASHRRGALGMLLARHRDGREALLELRALKVQAHLVGDFAETHVEHVFHNPSAEQLEGTFRFPLPDGAILVGLAMDVNGELVEGELVEREKARRTYEAIVEAMQDPALLEWEQGNTFKLRVFPIEPQRDKRVVLRYLAPLTRGASGWAYHYSTEAPELQQEIARFRLDFEGKTVVEERGFRPGVELVLEAARELPRTLRETRADASYTAVRLQPSWPAPLQRSTLAQGPRRLLLLVDTSRSALESRALALESLKLLLATLRPSDELLVLAADVTCRAHATSFVPASTQAIEQAVAFVEAIRPDGASDLGLALREAGARFASGKPGLDELVYLGDGTATWGETSEAALRQVARERLGRVAVHALVLGRGASTALLQRIAGELGGRVLRPSTAEHVRAFASQLRVAAGAPRLRDVQLTAAEGHEVLPRQPQTLLAGDELVAFVRSPAGVPLPRELVLKATLEGRPIVQRFALTHAAAARQVARRWAVAQIAELEAAGAAKPEIVKLSTTFGVLSRHTSFLVLESDEAYRRHQIERRSAQAAPGQIPQVSGADLESVGRAQASLSPDQLQPGDPELRIPAPADARAVAIIFPFGETKLATYEPALRVWTVRFLVDKATPDGVYEILVRITHASGEVEMLSLRYLVDTVSPTVRLSLHRAARAGVYELRAEQLVSAVEMQRGRSIDPVRLVPDAKMVEVQLPDGRVLPLAAAGPGQFRGLWRPRQPLVGPVTLRVVATDRAYNRAVFTVTAQVEP